MQKLMSWSSLVRWRMPVVHSSKKLNNSSGFPPMSENMRYYKLVAREARSFLAALKSRSDPYF